MNDRVLEVTRRTTACWKLQEEQQRVGSYKQNDSVASSTCCKVAEEQERRRQDVITPHPTPPHLCQRTENQFGRGPQKTLILRARFSVRWHKHT